MSHYTQDNDSLFLIAVICDKSMPPATCNVIDFCFKQMWQLSVLGVSKAQLAILVPSPCKHIALTALDNSMSGSTTDLQSIYLTQQGMLTLYIQVLLSPIVRHASHKDIHLHLLL